MTLPPIAIYCSSGSWGGLEMNTVRLAGWLHERGHSITLFCVGESPIARQAERNKIPYRVSRKNRRYADLPAALHLSAELTRLKIRFLILVDNRDLDFGALVKHTGCRRIRLIYQQHMRLGIRKKDPVHTLRFNQLDAWITLLPYMREEILTKTRFPDTRIHLIPLGLDVESFRSRIPSKQTALHELGLPGNLPVIGILGRLDPQKGQHLAIEAIQILSQQGEIYSLLIMGESTRNEGDGYVRELHEMITSYGLEKQVFIRNYQQEVGGFYAAIDLFVMGSYEETYGMVTIEAMLCGIPVVGSRAGGTTELLGNGKYGWLYQPKDPVDLAKKTSEVLKNKQVSETITSLAKRYAAETFSHTDECLKLENLLLTLI